MARRQPPCVMPPAHDRPWRQVGEDALLTALTTRVIATAGDRIVKRLSVAAAAESRDALAKNVYVRLFDWLVAAINRKISALGSGRRSTRTIGILDIYGFESFQASWNAHVMPCM